MKIEDFISKYGAAGWEMLLSDKAKLAKTRQNTGKYDEGDLAEGQTWKTLAETVAPGIAGQTGLYGPDVKPGEGTVTFDLTPEARRLLEPKYNQDKQFGANFGSNERSEVIPGVGGPNSSSGN